eukprot:s1718_g2.t1
MAQIWGPYIGNRHLTGQAPPYAVAPHFSSAPRSRHPAERSGHFFEGSATRSLFKQLRQLGRYNQIHTLSLISYIDKSVRVETMTAVSTGKLNTLQTPPEILTIPLLLA